MANDNSQAPTALLAGVTATALLVGLVRDCLGLWQGVGGAVLMIFLLSQWLALPRRLGLEIVYCAALAAALLLVLAFPTDTWRFAGRCAGPNPTRDMTYLVLWIDFGLLFALLRWFTFKVRGG
jgi:hypothetical protein